MYVCLHKYIKGVDNLGAKEALTPQIFLENMYIPIIDIKYSQS